VHVSWGQTPYLRHVGVCSIVPRQADPRDFKFADLFSVMLLNKNILISFHSGMS